MPFQYTKQPVKAVVSDVTGARALDTAYQNTTGRPILVLASCVCLRADVAGACAYFIAYVKVCSPPNVAVGVNGLQLKDNNLEGMYGFVAFAVPNEYYYQVTKFEAGVGSSVVLNNWIEVQL